jgi:hypothetical protein
VSILTMTMTSYILQAYPYTEYYVTSITIGCNKWMDGANIIGNTIDNISHGNIANPWKPRL